VLHAVRLLHRVLSHHRLANGAVCRVVGGPQFAADVRVGAQLYNCRVEVPVAARQFYRLPTPLDPCQLPNRCAGMQTSGAAHITCSLWMCVALRTHMLRVATKIAPAAMQLCRPETPHKSGVKNSLRMCRAVFACMLRLATTAAQPGPLHTKHPSDPRLSAWPGPTSLAPLLKVNRYAS
jgi:hypothetical protein